MMEMVEAEKLVGGGSSGPDLMKKIPAGRASELVDLQRVAACRTELMGQIQERVMGLELRRTEVFEELRQIREESARVYRLALRDAGCDADHPYRLLLPEGVFVVAPEGMAEEMVRQIVGLPASGS